MARVIDTPVNPEDNSREELKDHLLEIGSDLDNIAKLFELSTFTKEHINNIIKSKALNESNNGEILTEIINSLRLKFVKNQIETKETFKLICDIHEILYRQPDDYTNQIKKLSAEVQIFSENLSLNFNDLKRVIQNHNYDPNGEPPRIINLVQEELGKLLVYEQLKRHNAPFAIDLRKTPIKYENAIELILTLYRWHELQSVLNIDFNQRFLDITSRFFCHELLVSLSNICEKNLKKLTDKDNFGQCIRSGLNEISKLVIPLYNEFPCEDLETFDRNFRLLTNRLIYNYLDINLRNDQQCIAHLLYCSCMIRNKVMHGINYKLFINYFTPDFLLAIGVLFTSNLSILYLLDNEDQ